MLRIALCLSCFLMNTTAWADLTIQGTHYPGISGGIDREVIYLREDQMRVDQMITVMRDNKVSDSVASSVLIRYSGRPSGLLYIDHGSKRIQMLSSLREIGAAETRNVSSDPAASTVRVVKQDETRKILGQTTHRYDFSFAGNVDPLALLGEQLPAGMAGLIRIQLKVTGTTWVAPGMEGASELAGFFEQLNRRQLTIAMLGQTPTQTTHELSMLSPGLSSALTQVFVQLTGAGFPLLTQTNSEMKVDMEGAMAGYIQSMLEAMGIGGKRNTESIITGVQNGKLSPELFYNGQLPPGYSLNTPR